MSNRDPRDTSTSSRYDLLRAKFKQHQEARAAKLRLLEFDWRTSPRIDHGAVRGSPIRRPGTLELTLATGRTIRIANIWQYGVYAGLVYGIPPSPELQLIWAIEAAEQHYPAHGSPPLVLVDGVNQDGDGQDDCRAPSSSRYCTPDR